MVHYLTFKEGSKQGIRFKGACLQNLLFGVSVTKVIL